jgi:hypothetical protein
MYDVPLRLDFHTPACYGHDTSQAFILNQWSTARNKLKEPQYLKECLVIKLFEEEDLVEVAP